MLSLSLLSLFIGYFLVKTAAANHYYHCNIKYTLYYEDGCQCDSFSSGSECHDFQFNTQYDITHLHFVEQCAAVLQNTRSFFHCNTIQASHPSVCSGHGDCVNNGRCCCDENYNGRWCETFKVW